MTAAPYLGAGLLATLLVALRLFTWTAGGLALGAGRLRAGAAVSTTVAMLGGACMTMVVYAALASAGMLPTAVALDAVLAASAVGWRWKQAATLIHRTAQLIVPPAANARAALAILLLLLWIVASGPPRDGDVMHYHLAHIRQIIAAGAWHQLPICSYGIPFGWSLTYLPFEWIGLPQAAHLMNAGAWLLASALCIETVNTRQRGGDSAAANVARWMLLATTLLPVVLKAATTAMADAFLILDVALVLALLLEWRTATRGAATALGFAAFVGLTTRYQAAAVSISATLIVVFEVARRRDLRKLIRPFAAGALLAVAAASPFYIANQLTLGSAIWPFGVSSAMRLASRDSAAANAAAQLASVCTAAAVGGGAHRFLTSGFHLLVDRTAFPIPVLVILGALAVVLLRVPAVRPVAVFALAFLAVWAVVQPALSPRFSVYLVPAAVICCVPLVVRLLETEVRAIVRVLSGAAIATLAAVAILYAWDYLRLAVSGDVPRFHRATWYWPAYDWANRNTRRSSRFVVALYGGNTYPLDRWNVSADPGSSAVVPWQSIGTTCDLAAYLSRMRVDYLFYGPNVWTGAAMNAHQQQLIGSAIESGLLDTVRVFKVPIVYGRMEGLEKRSIVVLYGVDTTASRTRCLGGGGSLRP